MKNIYKPSVVRRIARFLLLTISIQIFQPVAAWALTSGPAQPEFSGFQPVGATDMVDKFTGDFTYSLPVMEVPGPAGSSYPLTLAYRSGANVEEDASWVGLGWSLSTGAINRNARGIPDDFNGEEVTHYNKTPPNYTFSTSKSFSTELFSQDNYAASLSASKATRYNRNTGFGFDKGIGITLGKGLVSLGVNEDQTGQRSYSARVNPMALLNYRKEPGEYGKPKKTSFSWKEWGKNALKRQSQRLTPSLQLNLLGGNRGFFDYNEAHRSTHVTSYTGKSYDIRFGVTVNAYLPIGVSGNVSASYTYQTPNNGVNNAGINTKEYGYLYSAEAVQRRSSQDDVIMDYYTEKDAPYNPRNTFIGLPFHNADIYSVSGEGLGGVFQLHHTQVGEFISNSVTNETESVNLGFDIDLIAWGAGASYGTGSHKLMEGGWNETKDLLKFSSRNGSNAPYFRFANDLGGTIGNDLEDSPVTASIGDASISLSDVAKVKLKYEPNKNSLANAAGNSNSKRSGQSSHIGYHTKKESANALLSYCKRSAILSIRNGAAAGDHSVSEFQLVNENGQQYTYGLPVYARNERRMQYGMENVPATSIESQFIAYSNDKTVEVGEVQNGLYATNYLLTEINSPDYVDRTFNGPSADDFGGYVMFDYERSYGGANGWYHWRTPYLGHYFESNSLSSKTDDMGSFQEGDKEIYYLTKVRTKTHTAVFELAERQDGFDALAGDDARNTSSVTDKAARKSLKMLKSIKLYPNAVFDDPNTTLSQKLPIKKIVFDYSYELCGNTPNAWSTTGSTGNNNKGKLTLKKIHTFYNNIEQGKPYEFVYKYPDYATYPQKYQSFKNGYEFPITANGLDPQNPNYNKFNLDAWGNTQLNGEQRAQYQQTWPNQRQLTATDLAAFDPAAWQLKVIKLPTGGEIHVQYEQDDYLYVQNQQAAGLASLQFDSNNQYEDQFLVDPASVGVDEADVDECVKMINDSIVAPKQKMYFRFLYNLGNGNAEPLPNGTVDNSEYVTGYVAIRNVEKTIINGKPKIKLFIGEAKNGNSNVVTAVTSAILATSVKNYTLPKQVCWDFAMSQRMGILKKNGLPPYIGVDESTPAGRNDNDAKNKLSQYVSWATSGKFGDIPKDKEDYCTKLNYQYSYFKIPLPKGKKGGGLRVKRLLTFEANNLGDEPLLYGSEYIYKLANKNGKVLTSGVATNEPAGMRAENALVKFIPGLKQSLFSKIISGVDKEQTEGPIGESQLPGAAVGYSRVVVKSIHSGETNPGFSVTEYNTCKEYPVKTLMTTLNPKRVFVPFYFGIVNRVTDQTWLTQGFTIVLNSMHGQVKREATYAGYYKQANTDVDNTISMDGAALVTEQKYTYFHPYKEEQLRLMSEPEEPASTSTSNSVQYRKGQNVLAKYMPGKEVDITMAQRSVREDATSLDIEADLTYSPPFTITPALGGSYTNIQTEYASHATTKVVRYPAIVQSVSSTHDNITETVENLAFDVYTGHPVAVRTSDTGTGGYLKQDVMGSWLYPQLGGRALHENQTLTTNCQFKLVNDAFYLEPTTSTDCNLLAQLQPGDVLQLGDQETDVFYADAPSFSQGRVRIYPVVKQDPQQYTAAELNTAVTKVRVVFSGRSNQLKTAVGSTTYYGHDRVSMGLVTTAQFTAVSNSDQLAIDLQNKIQTLSATATTAAFTLNGPYQDINLAGFQSHLSAVGEIAQAQGNTVTDLRFIAFRDAQDGLLRLKLVAFKVNGKEIK